MKYVPALDGVRALAILLVVLYHARTRHMGLPGGYLGVDVFFVLSGYLITRLLADEHARSGTIRLGSFYIKRARRLYPALLLMLACYLWLGPHFFTAIPLRKHVQDAAVSAMYLTDYSPFLHAYPARIGYTWSLAVEEHYYLVWPLLLLLLLKLPKKAAIASTFGLFVLATAWRWRSLELFDNFWLTYVRFDTRMSGLFLGGALGLWQPRVRGGAVLALAGLAGLLALATTQTLHSASALRAGMTLAEAASAALILGASSIAPLAWAPMVWIGRMSYGWYLWHLLLMRILRTVGMRGFWEQLLLGGGASLLIAAVSYYTVERIFRVQRGKPPILDQRTEETTA
jgi:peptidoglycan/LPS O-acetylase OafA/YrhL